MKQTSIRLSLPGLLAVSVLLLLSNACIVTQPPDTRGFKCDSDADCLGEGLVCYESFCRGSCSSGDSIDCARALNEVCNRDFFCVPPGPTCTSGQTRACYTGPSGTQDVGTCKAGTQTCNDKNEWGSCENEVTPRKEADLPCNSADDDCNGQVDDGIDCQCQAGDKRPCYDATDNGCVKGPNDTYQCKGLCKAGQQVCNNQSKWGACVGSIKATPEVCDNKDNNCDGNSDNNLTDIDKTCTVPDRKGPCAEGKTSCQNGVLQCNSSTVSSQEDCNGKDDDCDGMVDNIAGTSATLTRPCYSANKGCTPDGFGGFTCKGTCKGGVQTCLVNSQTWGTACEKSVTPTTETCNNKDDDCDGSVDNNPTDCTGPKVCTNGTCQ